MPKHIETLAASSESETLEFKATAGGTPGAGAIPNGYR